MKTLRAWLPGLALAAAVAALLVIVVTLVPADALARAGGGEKFPGFDGGGGGGGGGGDGIGGIIIWVILYSPIPWPCKIGLIVAIVVGGALMKRRRGRAGMSAPASSYQPPAPGYGGGGLPAPTLNTGAVAAQIEQLRARDPLFGQQHFEDTVSTAFIKIQEAWSKRDMSIARPFITGALLTRFQSQIDALKTKGWTNHVDDAVIGSVDIAEVNHDGGHDYITARVVAAAADYTTDDKTGQLMAGTKTIRQFTEYWSFLRSDKVKTAEGKDEVASKHCPNCAAPLQITAVGKCEYCGSDVTTGEYSWVLAEITQATAWRPRAQAPRPLNVSPLGGERYVLGLVQCPNCGAQVQDIAGITSERCWRCGATVHTEQ